MEPKLPAPNIELGRSTSEHSQSLETGPTDSKPETNFDQETSPVERVGESATAGPTVVPVLPTPVAAQAVPQPIASNGVAVAMPTDDDLIAKDDDLIEKEWVDKAKRIIADTRDDPHRREQEVGKLQADYLRKRYGKELGASD